IRNCSTSKGALSQSIPICSPTLRASSALTFLSSLTRSSLSRQVRRARVDDLGVGEDVDQGGPTRGEGAVERGAELAGGADQLAVPAEGGDDFVVAGLGAELGGERVAVEELHRVVLERPDPVVAHHRDDRQVVADHRVELHPREAEGAVAEQEADLALGVGELGAAPRPGPGPGPAVGAGVHPGTGLPGLPDPAGEADEVAAVAD